MAQAPAPAQLPIDPAVVTELAELDACSTAKLDAYNVLGQPDDAAAELLVDALECFDRAGRSAKAIVVLRYLQERHPGRIEPGDLRYRMREHYRILAHAHWAADTLAGRACGASVFDPPPKITVEQLLGVAECLEREAMFGVSLRYRTLAAERGAGEANAARIEELEDDVARLQRKIIEL